MAEYGKRHAAREKATSDRFRFLATVTARSAGNDVDYMEQSEAATWQSSADVFEAWLRAKAVTGPPVHWGNNGKSAGSNNPNQGPEGTPEGHEADGNGG